MEYPFLDRAKWVTDKYILVILGVFPLFVGLEGYDNVTVSKFWLFVVSTGIWAVVTLAMLVCGLLAGERYRAEIRPAHLAVGVFLAVGAVSAAFSRYDTWTILTGNRFDGYLTILLYALVFFGTSMLGRPRRRYMWAMGASSAVCCAIAVAQLCGLDPLGFYPDGTNYYDKYVAYNSAFLGTIGNTGLLAAYLCLAAPLLTVYAALSKNRLDRALFLPGALALGILVACDVDAGLVGLAGCLLITAPVAIQNDRAARAAGRVSGALTLAGLGTLYLWPGKSGTLYEMSQALHGHLADEFGSHRGQIWKQAWQLFKEHPWLGGGPGTVSKRLDIRWYSQVRDKTAVVTNCHNVYLGYLVNMGVFALLAYLAAVGCSLVTWVRRRKRNALYPALGAALVCYHIQDFFSLGLCLTAPMMWVIWGLLETEAD